MLRVTAIMMLAAAGAVAVGAAPECLVPTGDFVPTQVPYTYILDRSNDWDEDYFEYLKAGPPHLLEAGDLTAGHPYFGPLCDLAALRAGKPEKSVAEFVAEYRERFAARQEYVKQAHAAGVQLLISYVCIMTTGGDQEKRTGFWRFYDNWDAFREFHIPPRPEADPEQWLQRNPDGSPKYFYAHEHPPYRPMFRYANCLNNPGWQTYMQWLIEEAARVGLDGVFVDNAGSLRCYCPYCQAAFAQRLRARYTEAERKELFGGDLSLQPDLSKSDLRTAETQLFWAESVHDFLGLIRKWGAAIHGSFFVFPNGLHGRSHHIAVHFRDCDLAMDENSVGTAGTHPGVAKTHIIAGLHVNHLNDNLTTYKYAAGTGARCRANLLCRPGYPKSDPANLGANANVGALGIAEAAAFGGGGCYLHEGPKREPWLSPVRVTWNEFLRRNAPAYEGKYPFGQVGVIGFVLPNYFGDRSTFSGVDQVVHLLLAHHLLADVIPERAFGLEWLRRYPTVIVPYVTIMSDDQIETLLQYAQGGGKLILLGDKVATRDQFGRERDAAAVQRLLGAAAARYEWDLSPAFEAGQPLSGLGLCGAETAPLARFAAYVDDPARPRELLLHCVNYDVDLGTKHDRVGAIEDLALSVPLPPGARARSAVLKVPGEADAALKVESSGGKAKVVVPKLGIYGVVQLALEGGGAR